MTLNNDNPSIDMLAKSLLKSSFAIAAFALILLVTTQDVGAQPSNISELKTVAEQSGFKSTATFNEVVGFIDQCAVAEHVRRFDFGRSVEGRPMVAAMVANPSFKMGATDADDERLRILLLGNIHSGECCGKEALLAMLRELAADANHPWLKDSVIVIAPNYNVDANERVGLGVNHRPGQAGPENGMGQRENPMQLDLNRDFVKMESPEARSLVSLIDQFDPHMFIDCHTTNGSVHQFLLTYDIPHNPSAPEEIRTFLRNNMMPAVTAELKKKDMLTFFYGNFDRNKRNWFTYGHEPRYSTEYVGLRGRLGILSEAYSYASYEDRIKGTDAFVRGCVEHLRANAADVKQLLADVRRKDVAIAATEPKRTLIHLQSSMIPFADKVTIPAYDSDNETKKDYEVTFVGNFQPTTSVTLPYAYVVPAELSMHVERLHLHGIVIEQLNESTELETTTYDVDRIRKATRRFQKHNMVQLSATGRPAKIMAKEGDFVIRTAQPLGRLLAYMLEPETNEGLVTWNFLDPWLSEGQPYPIMRIEKPTKLNLKTVNEIQPGGKLRLTDIFGPDKWDMPDVSLSNVQWLHDDKSYSVEKNGRRIAADIATGAESQLPVPFELRQVTAALEQIDGPSSRDVRALLAKGIPLRGEDQRLFVLPFDSATFVFDSQTNSAVRLGSEAEPGELADLNPAGNQIAFVQNNNLMLLTDIADPPTKLTEDGSISVFNGKLDWVYQEELYGRGNFKGFWWSPDGKEIAWLRTDEAPVKTFTVVDHLPVRGRLEVTAYPKAGDPLPIVTLHAINVDSKSKVDIALPEINKESEADDDAPERLLISRVTWDKSDNSLLVQLQNRIQSWLDLCRVDTETGKLSVLFRDETPAWIDTPGDPFVLKDGSFLWLSPRSGYNAIYRYDKTGKEIAKLTNVDWEVREFLGCDESKQLVYFTGSPDTPTRVTGMSVRMDGTDLKKLLDVDGTWSLKFNKSYSHFLASHSTATDPDQVFLYEASGQLLRHVIPNREDRLKHLAIQPPEFIEIPIGESEETTVLDAMLFKPVDFDESQTYPIVVHIYGGPQAPRVRDRFADQSYLWHQMLAQNGYVVMVVDNRSASYRSIKQVWPIYGDMARRELADIEWAIGWMKQEHKWFDGDRVGLWGWSYGGYMTAYALMHSKVFKCGIAGAPVTDWRNYDAIYTERYMKTPQGNAEGYAQSSLLNVADQLHGELLLIHGTIDDNVHLSNSMQLASALQKAGKQFELMLYPSNRHSVRDPLQRLHLYQLMTDFFKRKL